MVLALYRPCFHRALRLRSKPSGVRGPVLGPPWNLQRPLGIAGPLQGGPALVRAPQRGALSGLPGRLPFFKRPKFRDTWASWAILAHFPRLFAPAPTPHSASNYGLSALPDCNGLVNYVIWWEAVAGVVECPHPPSVVHRVPRGGLTCQ
jgi:hypothetical protein